ncbi:LysR family transcriptional regulator [Vreelandella utahensis]|uniref:LysR family transcriptional regulator n=1 Tax=Vreelandella halophila TaxID=86177 RepID=UPI0009873140|nr:LysR family transcriptional regulator [Halomonas utahensis]
MVDGIETIGGALEDIRAFCAVAEFGTVSAAARQLGETKGGISRRLSRLEHRLGVTLLARAPRAVSPTEEGTAFYSKAREALAWLDDAAEGAQESQDVPRGHLHVTAPVDIGMELMPSIVAKFRTLYPQITVELLITDNPLDLAANRIDLALRAQDGNLPDMVYRASSVAQLRVGLYASPLYLEANGLSPETPAALADHHLVISHEFTGAAQLLLTDRRGRTQEVVIRPSIRTSDYASVLRLAMAGAGIGPIPDLVADTHITSGALVPVLADWRLSEGKLYAISLSGQNAPARVRVFREFIRKELNAV